ncbi:tRNA uridine-5-carboxymethylaminomethyl(34) synthesis GTPase MnmE [Magnetospirillum molischianum]|uniref:tRNA modification GTPase MnmE n=1 Tax=Magnetospirillum molischianum DSM 120 TaxID=1150626 RepID=H8FTE5_MAGML|nr:tRNA uridine-5-carboxymethylaminomethyl(34) synthesis GTPase MnmE [Magnetospirillum molischianum]CCG41633.1 putative tRNA modification GTPase (trmE) [Magnetospirillum molischianum DSM 120]
MADTIYALASGAGRAGIAVWRLSGEGSGSALSSLTGCPLPPARRAVRAVLRDHDGEPIDDGLVLWFPAPASFTGEDVVELHLHGGRAVAQALGQALARLGLRPAEPGEFSRRAFAGGKIDLTHAEAIADLVAAETSAQRRQALRQMDGSLAALIEEWRRRLVSILARLEAAIDFAEEDLPSSLIDLTRTEAAALSADLARHLADNRRGEILRDGLHITLLGAPNAGKSSLLNRLAGREAAIVSAEAGTTRDVIEIHLDLAGWPVILADTAGLREAAGQIEAEGVRRALARAEAADLKLAVFDAALVPNLDEATCEVIDDATLVVLNKRDLSSSLLPETVAGRPVVAVSAKTGDGLDDLLSWIGEEVQQRFAVGPAPVLTRARHRAAAEAAERALSGFDPSGDLGLAAESLRAAATALGRITGRVETDEVLEAIFREFCIGK